MNKHKITLVFLSFLLNLIFLYFHNPRYYYTMTQLHGQIGYNINAFNSCQLNHALTNYMHQQREKKGQLVDYGHIPNILGRPHQPFIINDTIGYGIILGLLWNLTHSFSFFDIQIVQIIIFSLLMVLLYEIALILFQTPSLAFICCCMQLLYFPILAMNVQPVRDIWAYYAIVLLLFGVLTYLFKNQHLYILILCCCGFSICQYIRPSVFPVVITMTFILLIYGYRNIHFLKKIKVMLSSLYLSNLLLFWLPFMIYNKTQYNRYFVGPVGLDLLEGLGEFDNPWGYKLSDEWAANYIEKKYHVVSGTTEFDDACKKEFAQAFQENNWLYFRNIVKRLPSLFLPGLPWIYYTQSPYGINLAIFDKIKKIVTSWPLLFDFFIRHIYIRAFLLLGYLGIAIAFYQRNYFSIILLLFGIVCGGWGKLPSHIEYRYLIPYYSVFAFFAGLSVSWVLSSWRGCLPALTLCKRVIPVSRLRN